jgi:hypothetical protein
LQKTYRRQIFHVGQPTERRLRRIVKPGWF